MNTRQTILAAVGVLLVVAIGVWWYFGFTLDFMRFFALQPTTDTTNTLVRRSIGPVPTRTSIAPTACRNIPPGCTCQEVQCTDIQAPCDPVIVCPSCVPRPSCMNDTPPCAPDLAPGAVLCPIESCQPRPACLDTEPRCMIAEPQGGWCPPNAGMVSCSPPTQTVRVGDMANISAAGGSGLYQWFAPDGAHIGGVLVGPDGPITNVYSVTYDRAGTKKVMVQSPRVVNGYNDPAHPVIDIVACTVVVTPMTAQPQ